MKEKLKNIVLGTPLERIARFIWRVIFGRNQLRFIHSSQYWKDRYALNGNSGAGSYGRLAAFKSEVLNDFVTKKEIFSVLELGCGDGNQLMLSNYPSYLGVDVSEHAINLCREKFCGDETKKFIHQSEISNETAELTLSLDVIYHLIEDDVFEKYMEQLFDSAEKFVIVYSCNFFDPDFPAPHVKPRRFTDWVREKRKDFHLIEEIKNRYPWDKKNERETSFADFFIYERI